MIEAVIFDFDGVVGDTMADNFRAWQMAFREYGIELTASEYYRLEGMGRYQIAQHFITTYKLPNSIENEVVQKKEAYYKQHNSFRIFDFIPEMFSLLTRNSIKIAIVSGASRERLNYCLTDDLKNQLSVTITCDDVINTKPHPEPYLTAIQKLNASAEQCIVIENALLGIESAKLAGCICYAIATTLPPELLTGADAVYINHSALFHGLEQKLNSLPSYINI